jgi:uncharacterized OB-fold protein
MGASDAGFVPVAEDLFELTEDGLALLGSKCAACGSHYFPQALGCRNPACDSTVVERARLGRRGRIYSYTVQKYQPPALFKVDSWEPYPIGLVELPEGLKVIAKLTGFDHDDLDVGTEVELVLEQLYRDDSGRDVVTYAYAPLDGRTAR